MAYEKQTWETGDTITAAKLNHMEDGISEGGSGGYSLTIETGGTSSSVQVGSFAVMGPLNNEFIRISIIYDELLVVPNSDSWGLSVYPVLPELPEGYKYVWVNPGGLVPEVMTGFEDDPYAFYYPDNSNEFNAYALTGNAFLRFYVD